MVSKKNVAGQGYICDYCCEPLETIWPKRNSQMHFCNANHSVLWREQNDIYAQMSKLGEPARNAEIAKRKETDFYAKMSSAGKAARSAVMPQSNREKPRRCKGERRATQ